MVASQKLTRLMASCIDMPGEGLVGLHVGAFDASVTVCNTEEGGRVPSSKEGWKELHMDENDLQLGQALLITTGTTTCRKLHMMFAPTSSNNWAVCYLFLLSFANKLACFPMLNLVLAI
jgi:hypothetical protein